MKLRTSLLTAAVVLAPVLVHAQGKGALAETAYNDGKRLFDQKQYAAACTKFQASMDLDPQRSTLQALAVCREREEKWASAWQNYLELARKFSAGGDEDKARLARERAADLEKKLLYIVLVMDAPPAGLSITIDGTALDATLLGSRLPVDPGPHDVVVTATNKKPWKQRVTVGPSPVEQQVKIAALEDLPENERGAAGNAYALPGPERPPPHFWTTQRKVGAIVGGVGIGALVVGGVFGILTLSEESARRDKADAADRIRDGRPLPEDNKFTQQGWRDAAESSRRAAVTNQILGITFASAGGAFVIGGIVLIATGGHSSRAAEWKPKSRAPLFADFSVVPVATPRSVGLAGTF